MNEFQKEYRVAKEVYDSAKARVAEALKRIPRDQLSDEQYVDAWMQLDDEHGLADAAERYGKAERALLEWGAAAAKRVFRPEQYAQVARCFEKPIYNPLLRQRLIDIVMKFQENK